jgi:hypothetical protein
MKLTDDRLKEIKAYGFHGLIETELMELVAEVQRLRGWVGELTEAAMEQRKRAERAAAEQKRRYCGTEDDTCLYEGLGFCYSCEYHRKIQDELTALRAENERLKSRISRKDSIRPEQTAPSGGTRD